MKRTAVGRTGRSSWSSHGGTPGFTLVEVLAALGVLLFGLAGIIGLLYGSFQHGYLASDRNAAAIVIPEALRQIEQEALITEPSDPNCGGYTETLTDLNAWPPPAALPLVIAGASYRTRYRLAKHPDWPAEVDAASPYGHRYAGVYVLTVVCYRDNEKDASRLVQISDPVTVFLREKK